MTEQVPQRPRRRVVLQPETPVPLPAVEDARMSRPRIPLTPPVRPAPAASGRRGTGTTLRFPAVPRPGRLQGVLVWVVVVLVVVAVTALVVLVASLVLLGREPS